MRRLLDGLYDACAWAAALGMVGVLVMVLASVLGRLLHFHLPGTDAYAGYTMAACGFLALAHTLKRNEHIRVTLLLGRLHGRARQRLELLALSIAVLLAGLFAWFSARLVWQSRAFNDISTGNDATPLWIPQLAMAAGTLVLLVAMVDEWVREWRGERSHAAGEENRHE
jgi:TRAP-type C4-dicarboxylate transport system permease small subunit